MSCPVVLLLQLQCQWCPTTCKLHATDYPTVCAAAVAVAVLVTWYTSGLGYLMSVVMAPQNSMVAAVATCMIVGGFLNGVEPRYRALSPVMQKVIGMQ